MHFKNSKEKILAFSLKEISQVSFIRGFPVLINFGLTGPQLIILQELSNGELTVSGLARRISLSQGTVTDIIHRLEKKDLIIRRRSNQDKRRVLITLSEKCKDLLALAPPALQETFTNSFSQIEEWEQLMILSSMNRIVKMMSAESIDVPPSPYTDSGPIGSPLKNLV